jgi:hypothetical protein
MRVRFKDWVRILVASSSLGAGCVAPTVAVVDQKTALEQQAAGGYPTLENELDQAGLEPEPEPFTREELASGRERAGSSALGDLAELYVRVASDADALDALLLQHCIGEASNGLLVARPGDCIGTTDAIELTRLIGRENLHRRQLWQLLAADAAAPLDRVQATWSRLHREQVVCGGLIERAEGAWEPKSC